MSQAQGSQQRGEAQNTEVVQQQVQADEQQLPDGEQQQENDDEQAAIQEEGRLPAKLAAQFEALSKWAFEHLSEAQLARGEELPARAFVALRAAFIVNSK